jgi:catechol 2,3-dioxygenase-like lactoylglutathione lyase family enzyme
MLLTDSPAFSAFATNDLEKTKEFYGRTLGLEFTEEENAIKLRIAGGGTIEIYATAEHTPAEFTILNFPVADVERAVDELAAAGLRFERYDEPGLTTDEKGVHRSGGLTIAWFRDPAGNLLSVIEQ